MNNKKSNQPPGKVLKITLSIICGLLVGGLLLIASFDWSAAISGCLAGIIIGALVGEFTLKTGLGKIFGFLGGVIGCILYRMLIFLVLQFSIIILLIVYFIPYILFAYIIVENEAQKNKKTAPTKTASKPKTPPISPTLNTVDPFFIDAGRLIIEKNKVSIGMLQRVYQIDFTRASNIIDQLCAAGVVEVDNGTAPRMVLMSMQEFEAYLKANGYL